MSAMKHISLDDYQTVKIIGLGGYSRVELCRHKETGVLYVLKVMNKEFIFQEHQTEHVNNERKILGMMDHPNIVRTFGTFQDETSLYILMEFVPGGEVFSHLRTMGSFDLDITRFYAAELALVFKYIHSLGIVYRDLKPENLLFTADGHMKMVDFGLARVIDGRTYTFCGTQEYMAPEIYHGEGACFASDWWSYGCFVYEMLVGATPFCAEDEYETVNRIINGEYVMPEWFDETTQDFISKLLTVDVSERLGATLNDAEEIMQHPWFEGVEWDKVYNQVYQPPLVPYIVDEFDSSNYPEFPRDDERQMPLSPEAAQMSYPDF